MFQLMIMLPVIASHSNLKQFMHLHTVRKASEWSKASVESLLMQILNFQPLVLYCITLPVQNQC